MPLDERQLEELDSNIAIFPGANQRGRMNAVEGANANPDEAAKTLQLSRAVKLPPELVDLDPKSVEEEHKSTSAAELVGTNPHLEKYVNSSPLAAKVSNDDYPQLDKISKTLRQIGIVFPPAAAAGIAVGAAHDTYDIAKEAALSLAQIANQEPSESAKQVGTDVEASQLAAGVDPRQVQVQKEHQTRVAQRGEAIGALAFGVPTLIASPLFGLFRSLISKPLEKATDFPKESTEMAAIVLGSFFGLKGMQKKFAQEAFIKDSETLLGALAKGEPWLRSGEEPPVGINAFIDMIKKKNMEAELDALDQLTKEVQGSKTFERDPQSMADFIRHGNDVEIGISSEAIRKLYGDKVPELEDGKLGHLPDFAQKLATAEATGGDVQVSLADWLTQVKPELAKELHDDLRLRPQGMTKNESKILEAKEVEESITPPTPIESVREAAGLKPLFVEAPKGWDSVSGETDMKSFSVLPPNAKPGTKVHSGLETVDSLYDYSLKDAIENINTEHLEGLPKELYSFFGDKLKEIVGDARIRVVKHEDLQRITGRNTPSSGGVPGYYSPPYHEIVLSDRLVNGAWGTGRSAAIVIHEGAHALTVRAINNDKVLRQHVVDMMAETRAYFEETNPAALKEHSYAFKNDLEFIAEAFSSPQLQKDLAATPMSAELAKRMGIGEGKKTVWDAVRDIVKNVIEKVFGIKPDDTILDGILQVGKLTEAKGKGIYRTLSQQVREALERNAKKNAEGPDQPELPQAGTTRIEDREIFSIKNARDWMPVAQYNKLMKLVEKQHQEDVAYVQKKIEADEAKRQTAEWKENAARLRPEVEADINNRPDIAADRFLSDGELYGEKLAQKPKIAADKLTPEQAELLPKNYVSAKGMDPNDIASMLGFQTGDELIAKLGELNKVRSTAGMRPKDFVNRLVEMEVERQMERKYGDLSKNILEEAKDHVLSATEQERLHEETLVLGMRAGIELTITKQQLEAGVREQFNELRASEVSTDKYLASAGRAGKLAEKSFINQDWLEAFKAKQQQYLAFLYAKEAKAFEKMREQFERVADRFKQPAVKAVEQEYTNYIHGLLSDAGHPIKLSPDEIAASVKFEGTGSLDNFVKDKGGYGIDLAVPEDYLPKPLDQMTVQDFREFKNAIDSLYHAGKDAKLITVAGQKMDYLAWRGEAIANLERRPLRSIEAQEKGGRWLYLLDAPLTRIEELMKDFDFRKEAGPFFKAIMVPFAQSKAKAYDMLTDLSKKFRELKQFDKDWHKTLEQGIEQDFIWDPYNQTSFEMTRWNMIKMMMNMGTESNFATLARGIATAHLEQGQIASKEQAVYIRSKIEELVHNNATAKDWQFVQSMFDMFKDWKPEADTLYRNLSGVPPKWVPDRQIATPHGNFAGGYFPLIPDKLRLVGQGIREAGEHSGDAPLGADYFRATVHNPFYKERRNATYWVDITNGIEQLAGRMQQMVHDIAYRDFVVNAGKVIYDPVVKNAIKKHYGVEYEKQLVPWLKRVANEFTGYEAELQGFNNIMRQVRLNLIAHALPLNYAVMLSPSLGTANLKQAISFNSDRTANMKLVMDNSRELKHMIYTLDRDVSASINDVVGKGKYTEYQMKAVETLFKPLTWFEQQSRAVTFYGEFMAQKAKGASDFEASTVADSLIRERHGATAVGDLPALMASKNEFVRTATVFMGYFTTQRNWLRQLPHEVREGNLNNVYKILWGTFGIAALYNAAIFTKAKQDEGVAHFMARAILSTPMSMIPYVREGWNYYTEGYQPNSPIFSLMRSVGEIGKDGYKAVVGKEVNHPVKHVMNAIGQSAGLPGALQIGRTADFLNEYRRGKQRPRNIIEWMRGIATGEARLKK